MLMLLSMLALVIGLSPLSIYSRDWRANDLDILALVLATALFIYLVAALCKPEWFE